MLLVMGGQWVRKGSVLGFNLELGFLFCWWVLDSKEYSMLVFVVIKEAVYNGLSDGYRARWQRGLVEVLSNGALLGVRCNIHNFYLRVKL